MNNFNTVFLAIKECCADRRPDKTEDRIKKIADKTGIANDKLAYYFDTLEQLGLIKYSLEKKTIELTSFGRRQEKLFA